MATDPIVPVRRGSYADHAANFAEQYAHICPRCGCGFTGSFCGCLFRETELVPVPNTSMMERVCRICRVPIAREGTQCCPNYYGEPV